MTVEQIKKVAIGKRLQTLYHGHVQIDWGEVLDIEYIGWSNSYRLTVNSEAFSHYIPSDDMEALCRDGIVEKKNEYNKQYKLEEINK